MRGCIAFYLSHPTFQLYFELTRKSSDSYNEGVAWGADLAQGAIVVSPSGHMAG